jgi:hypothetical protein
MVCLTPPPFIPRLPSFLTFASFLAASYILRFLDFALYYAYLSGSTSFLATSDILLLLTLPFVMLIFLSFYSFS